MNPTSGSRFSTSASPTNMRAPATTDGAVDFYVRKLLGFKLEGRKRDELIEYLNQTGDTVSHLHDPTTAEGERRTRGLVQLIMAMAEFQLC